MYQARRRRPRPGHVNMIVGAGGDPPEWLLKKREQGWNGRFAAGPSYFDVPGAIATGERGPHARRDYRHTTGNSSLGGAMRGSGKGGGKRMRVRTNMTPSLSRGRGDATFAGSGKDSHEFSRMEKMHPEEAFPTAGTAARAAAAAAHHQKGKSTNQESPGKPVMVVDVNDEEKQHEQDDPSTVVSSATSHHQHDQRHHGQTIEEARDEQEKRQAIEGVNVSFGGNSVGGDTGTVDAGVLVAATRAATGACMYREQLLIRLHALVDKWPRNESGPHGKREQQQVLGHSATSPTLLPKNKESRARKKIRSKVKGIAKSKAARMASENGGGGEGGRETAQLSTDAVICDLSSNGGSGTKYILLPASKSHVATARKRQKAKKKAERLSAQDSSSVAAAERRPRAARDLTYLAGEVRKAGLSCVESIVAWSLVVSPGTGRPTPFRWNSQDYLAKMHTDLDFVSEALGKDAPSFGKGNPLLLTRAEATGQSRAGKIGRYYAATYVTLDAANRARLAAATAPVSSPTAGQRDPGESKPRFDDSAMAQGCNSSSGKEGTEGRRDNGTTSGGVFGVPGFSIDDGTPPYSNGTHIGNQTAARLQQHGLYQERQEQENPKQASDAGKEQPSIRRRRRKDEKELEQDSDEPQPQEERVGTRPHPETGGVLKREYGHSELGGWQEGEKTSGDALENEEDLSDAYCESFEEFEEDEETTMAAPRGTTPQQSESDKTGQVREKAEMTLHDDAGTTGSKKETQRALTTEAEKLGVRVEDASQEKPRDGNDQWLRDEGHQREVEGDRLRATKAEDTCSRDDEQQRLQEQRLREERRRQSHDHEERQESAVEEQGIRREFVEEEQLPCHGDTIGLLEERQKNLSSEERRRLRDEEGHRGSPEDVRKRRREAEEHGEQHVWMEEEQQWTREEKDDGTRDDTYRPEWEDEEVQQTMFETEIGTGRHQEDGDMPTSIGDFDVDCLLGDGAYGWVYKCHRKRRRTASSTSEDGHRGREFGEGGGGGPGENDAAFVAIKQFKGLSDMEDEHTKNYVRLTQQREADLALSMIHPNIVRCLGTLTAKEGSDKQRDGTTAGYDDGIDGDNVAFLIFEHVPGTLLDLVQERPGGLTLPETTRFLGQILSAVGFLHQHGVVHRDVKPENILVDMTNPAAPVLKLCDLGTARKASESSAASSPGNVVSGSDDTPTGTPRMWTEYVGSRWYRAPEMLAGSIEYGTGVDVWACACLAAEMSSGRPLFPGEDEGELSMSMAALLGPLPPDLSSRLREMGYTPPPPRGRPTRSLEACLDGSTGNQEARRSERRSRSSMDASGAGNDKSAALVELLANMLDFDPVKRLSAKECLTRGEVFGDVELAQSCDPAAGKPSAPCDGSREPSSDVIEGDACGDGAGEVRGKGATSLSSGGKTRPNSGIEDDFEASSGEERYDDAYDTADEESETPIASADAGDIGKEVVEAPEVGQLLSRNPEDEKPVPPPQETAWPGKEEGYNSTDECKTITANDRVRSEIEAREDDPGASGNGEPTATAAEPDRLASGSRRGSPACNGSENEACSRRPNDSNVDAEKQLSSFTQPDVGIDNTTPCMRNMVVLTAVAQDVVCAFMNAAIADTAGGKRRTKSSDFVREKGTGRGRGDEVRPNDDNTVNNSSNFEQTDRGFDSKDGGVITGGMVFGDESYDSDSFDEGGGEYGEGELADIGGRTSFFPGLEPTAVAGDEASATLENGVIADENDDAGGRDTAGEIALSQNAASSNEEMGEPGEDPFTSKPESTEDNVVDEDDGERTAEADEAAEKDGGQDCDGWRVAGAFSVLAASGPGGGLASKAVKILLRQREAPRPRSGGVDPNSSSGSEDFREATELFRQALQAKGVKEGHVRRSVEDAFTTASSSPQEAASLAGDGPSVTRAAQVASVQRALETFAADVGTTEGEGLSTPRLMRLTVGLARCVDWELREMATHCQVWAAKARQTKRSTVIADRGPLVECSEYLTKKRLPAGPENGDSGDGAANGGAAHICTCLLLALCKAADRGRAVATADSIQASSSLESLSRVVCSLAPFILDGDRPKAERDEQLVAVVASMGLDEGVARQALLPSSLSSVRLLSAAGQAVLLRAFLAEAGERRVTVVTTREEALEQIELALESELHVENGNGDGSWEVGRRTSLSSKPEASLGTEALILNPYYLSPWGKKKVLGKRVEEGEGLGPRKELFELAARQLSERWRLPPPSSPSSQSPAITATAQEGTAGVELTINRSSNASERAFLMRIKEGWKVKVGGQTRTFSSVNKIEDSGSGSDDHVDRFSGRVTRLWMDGFRCEEASLLEACTPVLVYQQASESNWMDAKADRSNAAHRKRLHTLGTLLALSVTNACRLPVELPDLFFRWLLHGGEREGNVGFNDQQASLSTFKPSIDDMLALDPSLAKPFDALQEAVQTRDAFDGLLEIEELPADTSADDYISHMVRQTFLEPVQWQISVVRGAFFHSISRSLRGKVSNLSLPRGPVLAEIIRGKSPLVRDYSHGGDSHDESLASSSPRESDLENGVNHAPVVVGGASVPGKESKRRDFDFREAFLVYEDRDMVACAPLREAFWSVVQSELSPDERRLLLLFITGTDRLPEAGCETLSIEIPFDLPGGSDDGETGREAAEKALGQVPTAHTCDNVLELPNYWTFLMLAERNGGHRKMALSADDRSRLEARLRAILADRLRLSLNNATGYTLDDLDDEDDSTVASLDSRKPHGQGGGGGATELTPLSIPKAEVGDGGGLGASDGDGQKDFQEIPSLEEISSLTFGASAADGDNDTTAAAAAIATSQDSTSETARRRDGDHASSNDSSNSGTVESAGGGSARGSAAREGASNKPNGPRHSGSSTSDCDGTTHPNPAGARQTAADPDASPGSKDSDKSASARRDNQLGGYFDDDYDEDPDDIDFDVDGLEEVLV